MYADLSGWKSPLTLAVSITFFVRESRVEFEDVNQALRECRKPEAMMTFAYASDLTKHFADLIVGIRNRRETKEKADREREAEERYRRDNPGQYLRQEPATAEQISRLRNQFNGIGAMP